MLLGGMIGYERETANKPAGFRTHIMLAGALRAAGGTRWLKAGDLLTSTPDVISADPFRLVGGVVTALGFIGAGTIFRPEGQRVEGLTTATSLLFSGGIGVCAALQQWWLAAGATLLALVVLRRLQTLEARLEAKAAATRLAKGSSRRIRYILLRLFRSARTSIHALALLL
jgi:putative Mg2+ transporter-C (MgtC) family protein